MWTYYVYILIGTTILTGSLFIYNVKNLMSDTWKRQKLYTIIMVIAITLAILMQVLPIFRTSYNKNNTDNE